MEALRPPRVLVADDQEDVRIALDLLLRSEGFEVTAVDSPAAVLSALDERRYDAALVDLNYTRDTTSGAEGLDLLGHLSIAHPQLPLLVMTAWGTLEIAVAAMQRGARDFVLKPWENAAVVKALRSQIARDTRRALDLDLARRVQSELLPRSVPALRSLDLAARCQQAGAVGGDAYDFLELGAGRVCLVLADASGKGMPAALLVANLIGSLRSELRGNGDLAAALPAVNRLFHAGTATERYATLFAAVYDDQERSLGYANCGHLPPFLLRAGGQLTRLGPTAPAIGLFDSWSNEVARTALGPGDVLLVASDGVTDAESAAGEAFGDERLAQALRAAPRTSAAAACDAILAALDRFAGSEHEDDRTLLVARGR
jgi:sigma-B regulation protein RsbU (phosphoserine phosphatase)